MTWSDTVFFFAKSWAKDAPVSFAKFQRSPSIGPVAISEKNTISVVDAEQGGHFDIETTVCGRAGDRILDVTMHKVLTEILNFL